MKEELTIRVAKPEDAKGLLEICDDAMKYETACGWYCLLSKSIRCR